MGVEPTQDRLTAPTGFEDRPPHRIAMPFQLFAASRWIVPAGRLQVQQAVPKDAMVVTDAAGTRSDPGVTMVLYPLASCWSIVVRVSSSSMVL